MPRNDEFGIGNVGAAYDAAANNAPARAIFPAFMSLLQDSHSAFTNNAFGYTPLIY
jgi:hypothetical protein